jgi:hypothetical protein
MKHQFQREAHTRQDKAQKGDYREDLVERGRSRTSWLGVDMTSATRHAKARATEIQEARRFYFIYGKWLYQFTRKLSHFSRLNSAHAERNDPAVEVAFKKCSENWNRDFPKIEKAMKSTRFVKVGLPRCARKWEVLDWSMPDKLIADEVWRKIPPGFSIPPVSPAQKGPPTPNH